MEDETKLLKKKLNLKLTYRILPITTEEHYVLSKCARNIYQN